VLDQNFTVVLNGQTLNKQFSAAVLDGQGHAILTYSFPSPITVDSTGATIAIDFDLAAWTETNGQTTATIGNGSTVNVTDPTRQVTSRSVGFILNLVTGQSFDLKHGNHNLHVVMGPATQVNGTLKNNAHAFVYAVWSFSQNCLFASKVQVK